MVKPESLSSANFKFKINNYIVFYINQNIQISQSLWNMYTDTLMNLYDA